MSNFANYRLVNALRLWTNIVLQLQPRCVTLRCGWTELCGMYSSVVWTCRVLARSMIRDQQIDNEQ